MRVGTVTGVLGDVRSRSTLRVHFIFQALALASALLHLNRVLALRYRSVLGCF